MTTAVAAAAAPITFSDRGAGTTVAVSVTDLVRAAERAFRDMDIKLTQREVLSDRVVLTGMDGEWRVVADIGRNPGEVLTSADVTVSRYGTDFSRSRADQVLRTILNRAK